MNYFKLVSMLLLIVLLFAILPSCSSQKNAETFSTSTTVSDAISETVTNSRYADNLSEKMDFDGYTFRVLSRDKLNISEEYGKYLVPEGANGEIINDTAYERNCTVEERLGVQIKHIGVQVDRATTALIPSVLAGDDEYDICVVWGGVSDTPVALMQQNCILNLYDIPNMTINAEWYYSKMTDVFTLNNKLYIAGSYYINSGCEPLYMVFNKKLVSDYNIANPYETVNSGAWTWDTFLNTIQGVYSDLNGDGKSNYGDIIGYFNHSGLTSYMLAGFDINTAYKNSSGTYSPLISGEKLVNALEMMQDFCCSNPYVYENDRKDPTNTFMDGNALFTTNGTSWLNLRAIDTFDFGIIPFPKYDENQDDYHVYMSPDSFCVPVTLKNTEACGAVMEALSAASYKDLEPVYTKLYVEQKLLRDDESIEMLNMIKKNAIFDYTRYYDFSEGVLGGYSYAVDIIHSETAGVTSSLAKFETKLNKQAEAFYIELFGNE